jgi:hypothetical protein
MQGSSCLDPVPGGSCHIDGQVETPNCSTISGRIFPSSLLATGRISLPRFAVVSRAGKGTRPRS